jgi:hypothetical protein
MYPFAGRSTHTVLVRYTKSKNSAGRQTATVRQLDIRLDDGEGVGLVEEKLICGHGSSEIIPCSVRETQDWELDVLAIPDKNAVVNNCHFDA